MITWTSTNLKCLCNFRERAVFRVFVVMPLLPGFEGEIGGPSGTSLHAITNWNYASICRYCSLLLPAVCFRWILRKTTWIFHIGVKTVYLIDLKLPVSKIPTNTYRFTAYELIRFLTLSRLLSWYTFTQKSCLLMIRFSFVVRLILTIDRWSEKEIPKSPSSLRYVIPKKMPTC